MSFLNMEEESEKTSWQEPISEAQALRACQVSSRLVSGLLQNDDNFYPILQINQTVLPDEPFEGLGTNNPEIIEFGPIKFKKDYLTSNVHCSLIWPGLVLIGGLPNTKKTTIIQELLKRYVRKSVAHEDDDKLERSHGQGIDAHEVIAVGKKHQDFYWFKLTSLNCYTYCMASAILNDAALSGKVVRLSMVPSLGLFRNRILDRHFQDIYDELKKQKFLKPIDDQLKMEISKQQPSCPTNVWKKYLPRGLLVFNFWDLGLNKGILHTISALSGYFSNCYTCLFIDLERDGGNLFEPPSLDPERFSNHPDKNVIYNWRSRVQYLLRLALFAKANSQLRPKQTKADMINMKRSCFIVAVHEGSLDVDTKIKNLREVIELIAEQMGLTSLLDFNILAFDLEKDESYRELKSRLEDRITQESLEFPLSWLFIRSAYYRQDNVYVLKSSYYSLAKECNISEEEFESFLGTFTASGSLIYASHSDSLSNYVILKPTKFFETISKIFSPKKQTDAIQYGIITQTDAIETFGKDHAPFYMTALTSLHLAFQFTSANDIDLMSAGLNISSNEPIYHLPALRCTPPDKNCVLDSLHVLFSIDIAPKSTQVAFIHSAFKVFCDKNMNIKLIPCHKVNVIQFEVSDISFDIPHRFEHVYHGDITEIRLHTQPDTPDAVCQRLCDAIIATVHATVHRHTKHYGPMKYGFAVMCSKDQDSSQPCNVKNVRHYLPELDETCNACHASSLLKFWINSVKKYLIDEDKRLNEDSLEIGEILKIASHIATDCTEESLQKLAVKLNLEQELVPEKVRQFGKKKYIVGMIIEWEKKRNKQEPARMEFGRILNDLDLKSLAATLRLSNPE